MTTNISELYKYSELAYATYSTDLYGNMTKDDLRDALLISINGVPFSEKHANDFSSRYEAISHVENTDNGFSATLFKDASNNSNEFILSIRGTESPLLDYNDWFDADFEKKGTDLFFRK